MIEWDNQQRQLHPQQLLQQCRLQPQQQRGEELQNGTVDGNGGGGAAGAVMYVKVMTDEQLEILRRQIAVYAEICEQLVEAHKNLTAQQDLAGARLGNLYCDPFMAGGHKITSRQRWTPTPMQLQILEHVFDQGNGTPSKQRIKDITAELSEHGQISETNVYNWFQNRRARSKRKQQNPASNNYTTESEADAEVESAKETKTNAEDLHSQPQHNSASSPDLLCFQNSEMCHADMQYLDPQVSKVDTMISSDGVLKPTSLDQLPMFDGMLSNSGNEYLTDEMEVPENYNFQLTGNYNVTD